MVPVLSKGLRAELIYFDLKCSTIGAWYKDLVAKIVRALVDHPYRVSVTEIEGENTPVLELKVAKSDMGKVIGRQGRHADAIRTLFMCCLRQDPVKVCSGDCGVRIDRAIFSNRIAGNR